MNFHDTREPIAVLHIPRLGIPWVTQNDRVHWGKRASIAQQWREMVVVQAHRQQFPKNLPPCVVEPTFVFNDKRHRDPGNFTATTKVIIDALKTGKKPPHGWGAWPDDDPRYLTELMPRLVVRKQSPPGVILRIYARPEGSRYDHRP